MRNKTRKNRERRSLRVESLEKRELMAANPVMLSGRTLNIAGSTGADHVTVQVVKNSRTGLNFQVLLNGNRVGLIPAAQVDNIFANLGHGDDTFKLQFSPYTKQIRLNELKVDVGQGYNQNVRAYGITANKVTVNAAQSSRTEVTLGLNVTGTADLNMGSGNDKVTVVSGPIQTLDLNAGAGDDTLVLGAGTAIANAKVKMGAGTDTLTSHRTSVVTQGTIDGGGGISDKFSNGPRSRPNIRARIIGFERA